MKGTLNTIHYCPLQAISFPTALLSETILFIDGKRSNQQEGEQTKTKINEASAQSVSIGTIQEAAIKDTKEMSLCAKTRLDKLQKQSHVCPFIFSLV